MKKNRDISFYEGCPGDRGFLVQRVGDEWELLKFDDVGMNAGVSLWFDSMDDARAIGEEWLDRPMTIHSGKPYKAITPKEYTGPDGATIMLVIANAFAWVWAVWAIFYIEN